jgi:hypothetical protein
MAGFDPATVKREGLPCDFMVGCRPRQRRIVVSLTPSSTAKSATGLLLRWM